MSRIRLQASPCNTGQRAWYTVNLDGVPLGCQDDLRGDPALIIIVESEIAKALMGDLKTDDAEARALAPKLLVAYRKSRALLVTLGVDPDADEVSP